jgi:hypothetical protein
MTETKPAARTCALVLGMHRSGTSAVTRVINLLGAALPKDLMVPAGSNEAGHWEPRVLVEFNDQMLLEGGSAWNDWRPFDPLAALGPQRLAYYRAEISRRIDAEFTGQTLFVLKDPRISRFTPLYLDCLADLGVGVKIVLMSRHPLEVAGSLQKRDSMPRDYALRLWLRHDLDAEAATRGLDRIAVSYDSVLSHADGAIAKLRRLLAPATPEGAKVDIDAARASLRGELRHHASAIFETGEKSPPRQWAEAALAAFTALERDDADARALAALDALRPQLDEDARLNGETLAYSLDDARRARVELADVTRQRDGMIERSDELEGMVKTRDAWLREMREAFAASRRQHIIDLASALRPDYGDKLPKQLSRWRSLNPKKRERIRRRREQYLAVRNSPLFDVEFYVTKYPDVAARGEEPILHYLSHGSDEGRWPSAAVDPIECLSFFPELRESEGNLVLRLIALLGPVWDEV